ncbi:MAG: hypothetical protein EXS63_08175 [Candidatus Omnitrophica bacterium]|nr:hypothetical protein [Candidatus Omnitrophota bacterium]
MVPVTIFESFVIELRMFGKHLQLILLNISSIEDKIQQESEEIRSRIYPEYHDEGDVRWKAEKKVMGEFADFDIFRQKSGAIAGYCVIIFHLFERFIEEVNLFLDCNGKIKQFVQFKDKYADVSGLPGCSLIDELRLLCNVCKHGTGPAYEELKKTRPDYFDRTGLRFSPIKLLAGYDLNIEEEDFLKYSKAITDFTESLASKVSYPKLDTGTEEA